MFTNYFISNKIRLLLFKILLILVVFPEFGPIRLSSDTQPYFFVVALFLLFTSNWNDSFLPDKLLIPFFLILVLATISFTITIFKSNNLLLLFRSYFGYISSFVVLLVFFLNRTFYKKKVIIPVLDLCLCILYLGFVLNILGFNWVVRLFVNRGGFSLDMKTGLVSFYTEQSHMVTTCFILFFLYLHAKSMNILRLTALVLAILLSASGQSVLEMAILIIFYFISLFLSIVINKEVSLNQLLPLFFSVILFSAIIYFIKNNNLDFRAFKVFKNLNFSNVLQVLGNDNSVTWKVQGIFLIISTLIATPFVFQISSLSETDAISRLYSTHNDVYKFLFGVSNPKIGEKVFSAFGTWIVDFGLIGFLILIIFAYFFIKNTLIINKVTPLLIISILYTFYVVMVKVSLSCPTIILLLFSTYNKKNVRFNFKLDYIQNLPKC